MVILGFLRAFVYFIVGIPVTIAGAFVVPVALMYRIEHPETRKPFTQYVGLGDWWLITLPAWAKWWSNEFDGALGDARGWWANYCLETYGKPPTSYRAMWQWLVFRNPANWWSRVVTGVDMLRCKVEKVFGDDVVTEYKYAGFEWQILKATRDDGKVFPRFYLVAPWWFRPDKAVMIDIGWKIKLAHNNLPPDASIKDRVKGSVFAFSPWKSL